MFPLRRKLEQLARAICPLDVGSGQLGRSGPLEVKDRNIAVQDQVDGTVGQETAALQHHCAARRNCRVSIEREIGSPDSQAKTDNAGQDQYKGRYDDNDCDQAT